MKKSEIMKLSEKEFIKMLDDEMLEYVREHFEYDWIALEQYQDGARCICENDDDEYPDVNDYFRARIEQDSWGE